MASLPRFRLSRLLTIPIRLGFLLLAVIGALSLLAVGPLAIAWSHVDPGYHLLTIGIVVLIHFLAGRAYGGQVKRLMADRVQRRTTGNVGWGPKTSVTDVRLVVHQAEMLTTKPGSRRAQASYRRLMNRRGAVFTWSVVLGVLFANLARALDWATRTDVELPWVEIGFAVASAAFVLWLVFAAYRRRGTVSVVAASLFGVWSHGLVLFVDFGRQHEHVGVDLPWDWLPLGTYFVTIGIGWGIGWALDAWQRRRFGGWRLLVLRTFGFQRQTESLFAHVAGRWSSLGPFATIIDPSYARFRFRRRRRLLLLTMAAILATPFALLLADASRRTKVDAAEAWSWVEGLGSAAMALPETLGTRPPADILDQVPLETVLQTSSALALYYGVFLLGLLAWATWRLRATATQSVDAVRYRLALERSATSLLSYPSFELACFDNVWLATVKELVPWADVVLFDLRGYHPGREGCDLELQQLVDRADFRRVVFLADPSTDLAHFEQVVKAAARTVDAESPAARALSVVLTVFVSDRVGREIREDLPSIFGLLARITTLDRVPRRRASWRTRMVLGIESLTVMGWVLLLAFTPLLFVGAVRDRATWSDAWGLFAASVLLLMTSYRMQDLMLRQGDLTGFWKPSLWLRSLEAMLFLLAATWATTWAFG